MKLSEQLEQFVKLNGEAGYGTVPTLLAEMWLSEVKELESRTVGGMIAEGLEELVELRDDYIELLEKVKTHEASS